MESIVLTGPKFSGKTSTGRVLALLCSCEFIDLDDLILQKTGKTPRQLYIEDVACLKKTEADIVAEIIGSDDGKPGRRVIATGGGIIDNAEAIAILEKTIATVVYLNISAADAWDRIVNAPGGELPPFLRTENPRETHRNLHERRAAAYPHLAKIIIETEGKTPEKIAHEIVDKANWGRKKPPNRRR